MKITASHDRHLSSGKQHLMPPKNGIRVGFSHRPIPDLYQVKDGIILPQIGAARTFGMIDGDECTLVLRLPDESAHLIDIIRYKGLIEGSFDPEEVHMTLIMGPLDCRDQRQSGDFRQGKILAEIV